MATALNDDNVDNDNEADKTPTVKQLKLLAFDLHEAVTQTKLAPDGFGKFKRKVLREVQHLQTLNESLSYNSSNIHYLHSIWQTILNEGNNVSGVFKKYKYITSNKIINDGMSNQQITENTSYTEYNSVPRKHRTSDGKYKKTELIVDIVCDDGLRWIKVKTSNPYSMQMQFINSGSSSKGKNIVTMADNFINAANQHQVYFQSPKIEFVFIEGITSDLAYILKSKGIHVKGKEIKEDFLYHDDDDESDNDNENETDDNDKEDSLDESCVNLGVRTMLTMISSLANGEIDEEFFDELQGSLLEKQQDIINKMFSNDSEQEEKKNNDNDNKPQNVSSSTAAVTAMNNLEFEYCDYDGNPYTKRANGTSSMNEKLNDNGYTLGHQSKLTMSSSHRRKKFSEKSYEEQKMLLQMYIDERTNPVLPTVDECIENKKLVCCESAWNHFMDIVNLSAGKNEWKRCIELQSKIKIVPDQMSLRTKELTGKSMSNINKCVFGTGDSLKIITITAVASFVRKAEQRGIKYFTHIHPVRPLTERYQCEYQKKKQQNENIHKLHGNDGSNLIPQLATNAHARLVADNHTENVLQNSNNDNLLSVD